ncbi:hypothetical protein Pelo_10529 [Pelomyxa schiedti]|nr:hypothetical protein Pelo_10529 [Pelomyxa schiedti]
MPYDLDQVCEKFFETHTERSCLFPSTALSTEISNFEISFSMTLGALGVDDENQIALPLWAVNGAPPDQCWGHPAWKGGTTLKFVDAMRLELILVSTNIGLAKAHGRTWPVLFPVYQRTWERLTMIQPRLKTFRLASMRVFQMAILCLNRQIIAAMLHGPALLTLVVQNINYESHILIIEECRNDPWMIHVLVSTGKATFWFGDSQRELPLCRPTAASTEATFQLKLKLKLSNSSSNILDFSVRKDIMPTLREYKKAHNNISYFQFTKIIYTG